MNRRTETSQAVEKRSAPFKRRTKWIRPDIQLKIVLRTLFVAILVLLINFQLSLIGYWLLFQGGSENGGLQAVPSMLLKYFAISLGVAIPLSIMVAILSSFSFCGPLFRFSRYFHDLVDGRWDRRCRIRKTDDLQDVNETINLGIEALTARIRDQHDVLQQARAVLAAPGTSFEDADHANTVIERIDLESKEFSRRFSPEGEASASGQAEKELVTEASA